MEKLITVILSFIILFARSLAIWLGWKWFVVPLGIFSISYFHAMGILLLITTAKFYLKTEETEEKDEENRWIGMLCTLLGLWFLILIMLVTSLFM